jgi:hypothetical protein
MTDPDVLGAFRLAIVAASVAGSAAAVVAARTVWPVRRTILIEAISYAAAGWAFAVASLGPTSRDLLGVFVVVIAIVRLAPGALAVVSGRAPRWLAFLVSLGGYAAMAAWLPVASLPFGDQIHYLLVADHLAQGTAVPLIDVRLFTEMLGFPPSATDAATHVALTPAGLRPIQGYALPLLILPGWALAGRTGAGMMVALAAAWTSYQTLSILRDLLPARPRVAGATWLIASACAPLSLLATHIYPNALGAALIATAFRSGLTAPIRRPALAAALLALTLFLTPRDAVPALVLLPFLLRDPGRRRAVATAAAAIALVAVAANALLYGLPIPYAGYAFGTAQAQEVTREPSITPFVWVTLPAILFDRTFGLAGSAPWVFIGLLGLAPALRSDRSRLLPAALAIGVSVVALSFFRLWEGGYAPPARYFVDVLPLWAPFVAYGLTAVRAWPERVIAAFAVGMSALTSIVLNAIPTLALNTAFDDKIRTAVARVLGLDPLAWLPSFQPTTPTWYLTAYAALLPALAVTAALLILGLRSAPGASSGDLPIRHRTGVDRHRSSVESAVPSREQVRSTTLRSGASARDIAGFLVASLMAIAWLVAAVLQPWIATGSDPVHESLLRKWLPLSLGVASVGTALVARVLAPDQRRAVLIRHHFFYLVPLALMLVVAFGGPGVLNGQLGAIYLLIAVGFAVHALAALWSALDRLGDLAVALHLGAIVLVAAVVLLPYHRAVMPTASDEPHYLIVAQSLLYDRDLDVRNDYEGDRYSAFYPTRLPDMHAVEVGRAAYSIRDLGLPILSVIPFALAGRIGVLALMCAVGAALAAQLYLLLRDLGFAPRVGLIATATTALVHPILTYTTQIYPELLTGLVFVSAVRVVRRGARATIRDLAIASVLVGLLPWLSTRAWPTVVGVGIVVAYCALRPWWRDGSIAGRTSRIAAGALPFAALVLALAYVNWRTLGVFLPSAGYFLIREQQPVLTYTAWIGAPGLLFDRAFGLVPRAPVYLLAFLGALRLWRRSRADRRPQLLALAAGSLLSFLYIADIAYWWADGSPPSRYMLGSIPLLVAAVAAGWEIVLAAPIAARTIAWLAVGASAAVAYVYAVLPNIRYDLALDVRATGSSGALFSFLERASGLDAGKLFPSMVRTDLLTLVLVIAWVGVAGTLVWAGRRASLTAR